jgi:hypothetical protein
VPQACWSARTRPVPARVPGAADLPLPVRASGSASRWQLGSDARDVGDAEFALNEAIAELEQVNQPVADFAAVAGQPERLPLAVA